MKKNDKFSLHNLKVEIIKGKKPFVCGHKVGDYFEVVGENIYFTGCTSFSMYSLATLLPLLPAKQRMTSPNDWMTTDSDIACPDLNCGGIFRITRTGKSLFRHSETTVVPLKKK